MLRIWLLAEKSSVTVRLEGKLLSPWRDELRDACDRAAAHGLPLKFDFSKLAFVDADGVDLLRGLIRTRNISVGPCSSFVAELLNGERKGL